MTLEKVLGLHHVTFSTASQPWFPQDFTDKKCLGITQSGPLVCYLLLEVLSQPPTSTWAAVFDTITQPLFFLLPMGHGLLHRDQSNQRPQAGLATHDPSPCWSPQSTIRAPHPHPIQGFSTDENEWTIWAT